MMKYLLALAVATLISPPNFRRSSVFVSVRWWIAARTHKGLRVATLGIISAIGMLAGQPVLAVGEQEHCVSKPTGSLTVSAASINLGQPATVNWNIHWPSLCADSLRLYYRDKTTGVLIATDITGVPIPLSGSKVDRPQSSGTYFFRGIVNGHWEDFGSANVDVALPFGSI
jgi:hypothetical protein